MNQEPREYIHPQTRYIRFRHVCDNDQQKRVEMDDFMTLIATRITEALNLIPECSGLEVSYRNILERDANPDGYTGFFRILDHRAFGKDFCIQNVNLSIVPQQKGDTENNVSVGE